MAESGNSVARKKRIKLISLEGAGDNFLGGCFKKMLTLTQGQHFFIFIKDDNTDYFCIIAFLSSFCLLYYLGKIILIKKSQNYSSL